MRWELARYPINNECMTADSIGYSSGKGWKMVALVGRMAMDQGKVMISPKELLVNTLMGGLQSKAVSSSCIVLQASLTVRRRMDMGEEEYTE